MRLLNVRNFEIQGNYPDSQMKGSTARLWNVNPKEARIPPYVILSHRWRPYEITFSEFFHFQKSFEDEFYRRTSSQKKSHKYRSWRSGLQPYRASFEKISGVCREASSRGINHVWIDTVCINKADASETVTAINTMFQWYRKAERCVVYLHDVSWKRGSKRAQESFGQSDWWSRGWTLQELLAPATVEFYDYRWRYIGDRDSLARLISQITGISRGHLSSFMNASVAQKFSWLASRQTTKIEDMAYCMLGLFGVYMDVRYGQGEQEFLRLQGKIIQTTSDQSIFAWRAPGGCLSYSGLLAPGPACFKNSGNVIRSHLRDRSIFLRYGRHGMDIKIQSKGSRLTGTLLICLDCEENDTGQPIQVLLSKFADGIYRRQECSSFVDGRGPGLAGVDCVIDIRVPHYSSLADEQSVQGNTKLSHATAFARN